MTSWIVTPLKRPDARANLLVVPHAGASANFFHRWIKHVPDEIELHLVEMPGRGRRVRERLLTHWSDVVDAMLEEIAPLTARPLAVFGHSMGAHIAYRVLTRLDTKQSKSLLHFFPSASKNPLHVMKHGFFASRPVSDDEFISELRGLGGAEDELLRHAEFVQLLLRVLRADYDLCESLADAKDAPALDCNMTALAGRDDQFVSGELVEGWHALCRGRFEISTLAGGHFYFDAAERPLPTLLIEIMRQALQGMNAAS